jgi:hypothetical protein
MAIEEQNKHTQWLVDNVKEVRLLRKYRKAPNAKDKEVLYKSCIVLLVACWESFVEDLVTHALEHMVEKCADPSCFPPTVLERVSSSYNGPKVWALAGDGWRHALRDNLKSVLGKTSGIFNTPKCDPVNDLFKKVIGLENISHTWTWDGKEHKDIATELDELITLRGSIAHRVKADSTVGLEHVTAAEKLILYLAVRSHNQTLEHLKKITGVAPWNGIKYQEHT